MGFKSIYQKNFNQKINLGKNVAVAVVYFCYRNASLRRERISPNKSFLATAKPIYMSVNKK